MTTRTLTWRQRSSGHRSISVHLAKMTTHCTCSVGVTDQHAWIQSPKWMTHNHCTWFESANFFFSLSLCISSSQPNSFFSQYTYTHNQHGLNLAWRTHIHALVIYFWWRAQAWPNIFCKCPIKIWSARTFDRSTCNPYFDLCEGILIVVVPFSVGVQDDPGFTEEVCECVCESDPEKWLLNRSHFSRNWVFCYS